ncbi:hypothetical protein VTJ04DRAFT_9551 [Mycothermus thermophilus]|uniref:uncharacterized protein n=1 Tax=Humicola insolens TaxID=85995 RepID=UPI003742380B
MMKCTMRLYQSIWSFAVAKRTSGRIQSSLWRHPAHSQRRYDSVLTRPKPDDIGLAGGPDHFGEEALRRKYIWNTVIGTMAACSVLVGAKLARMRDPNAQYVLVHDASKGELDDVKYIKASELPKTT